MVKKSKNLFFYVSLFLGIAFYMFLLGTGCSNPQVIPASSNNEDAVKSDDADLKSLILKDKKGDSLSLEPSFNKDISSYKVYVTADVKNITLIPVLSDVKRATAYVESMAISDESLNCFIDSDKKTIVIKVVAEDESVKNYQITVFRKNDDTKLSGIQIKSKSGVLIPLTPSFDENVSNYQISISSDVNEVDFSASLSSESALMYFGDSLKESGKSFPVILFSDDSLSSSVLELKVVSESQTEKIYKITALRKKGEISSLKSLTLDNGTLSPYFQSGVKDYTVTLSNDISECKISPVLSDAKSSVKYFVENVEVENLNCSNLKEGNNLIKIEVTSEDGKKSSVYSITLNRASLNVSNDADISSLTLSAGVLSPAFDKNVLIYEVSLGTDVKSIEVSASKSDVKSTFSFSKSMPMSLSAGVNTLTISVTAEDGVNKKEYKINFNVASTVSNAFLANLSFTSVSSLSPIFNKNTFEYAAEVAYGVNNTKASFTSDSEGQTVELYKSTALVDANEYLTLSTGDNVFEIKVKSKDSLTTNNYKVTIKRLSANLSSNAYLSALSLSSGNLSFNKNTFDYSVTLANAVSSIKITPTAEDKGSIKIGSVAVQSGVASSDVQLNVGENNIKIEVTAEDGVTKKEYKLVVTRGQSSNANLSGITLSEGLLNPSFNKDVLSYSVSVGVNVSSVTVTPSVVDGGVSTYALKKSGAIITNPVALSSGDNMIDIEVTAGDGVTKKIYSLNISKVQLSDNAYLSSLILKKASDNSNLSYAPSFNKNSLEYSITVANGIDSVILSSTAEDTGKASITVNGISVTSGGNSTLSLQTGLNTLTIVVTAEDNSTKKNYVLDIARETVQITDKIILHAKNYGWVYLWETTDTTLNAKRHRMTDEGNLWAGKTISVTSAKIIFTPADSWDGKTADLSRTAGEWWYKDGAWTDYNPESPKTPVITASPSPKTYIDPQNVTLTGSNGDDEIYYTLDGSTPSSFSTKYSVSIEVSSTKTVKAIGYNAGANPQWGEVYTFSYTIDPNADFTAPVITPSKDAGVYQTATTVSFNIQDNKNGITKAYYTTDGSSPTVNSPIYAEGDASGSGITGNALSVSLNEGKTFNFLVVDSSGNQTRGNYYYYCGEVTTTRFDPRQESIYFLLTSRWFDGDTSNSVGDEWCSWTEERANDAITDDGFTGPEDLTWRGDFKGLVEKMDYIKALGFTAIWITPIVQNRSPLAYHGYHGWDFTREDRRLESAGYNFQRVINEAHARGMKICLDIVINHSGRYGIKDFSEIKYNTDIALYPMPDEWSGWSYGQATPNNWSYDGLTSPGTINGVTMPAYQRFGDIRPFSAADVALYPNLLTDKNNGILKYQWPCTESYCKTIDGVGTPGSLTYEQYKTSPRRHRGHNTGFPTGSGSFDNFPDAHLDSLHEDCPDLNTENPEVQDYLLSAYYRYIDMGVDMFRVDTVMHIHKTTLNEMYWPQLLARAEQKKSARGGADFFIFGEVANFVCNPTDKQSELREQNYTFDNSVNDSSTQNHKLDGNNYRTPDYSHKAPNASAPGHVSVINMIAHNSFCNGHSSGYNTALGNDHLYNDATFMPWYADSHDYGPNKGATRYSGDFKPLWSMLFTFRGIPVVYYGSEIRFKQGMPNDWPGGGSNGANMSLEKTGRGYYGVHLDGNVTATDFGTYTADGTVATTLSSAESQHLMRLNKIRLAVPALQMGQYSTDGCSGGWASFKRRYTGTNKITGQAIDSYCVVGIGSGNHSYSGILNGKYVDCVTGDVKNVSNGTLSFDVPGDDSNLRVYVLDDLTTKAPGDVVTPCGTIY